MSEKPISDEDFATITPKREYELQLRVVGFREKVIALKQRQAREWSASKKMRRKRDKAAKQARKNGKR